MGFLDGRPADNSVAASFSSPRASRERSTWRPEGRRYGAGAARNIPGDQPSADRAAKLKPGFRRLDPSGCRFIASKVLSLASGVGLRCVTASDATMFAAPRGAVYNGAAMNKDDGSQSEVLSRCPRCGSSHDVEDNFCRRCGAAFQASRVPMVRDERSYAPVPWRETMPVVVRGAAVVAASTLAEAVLRRLVARALRGPARPSDQPVRQAGRRAWLPARRQPKKAEVVEHPDPTRDDDHLVSETVLFRRVRLRNGDWPGE